MAYRIWADSRTLSLSGVAATAAVMAIGWLRKPIWPHLSLFRCPFGYSMRPVQLVAVVL